MKKMKIALLGTQASGKGTQAYILSVTTGTPVVSVGNLLRDASAVDSEQGSLIKEHLSKGTFPPDETVLKVLREWMEKHPEGWIIDGFPRTKSQAEKSADFFQPDAVVSLDIPDEDARRRISYRRVCVKCRRGYNIITQPPKNSKGVCDACGGELIKRSDDTPELINERLKLYHVNADEVKDWYRKKGTLIEVDGRAGIKETAHEVETRILGMSAKSVSMKRWQAWLLVLLLAGLVTVGLLMYTGSNLE
jgi:adenylate kinase